MIRGTRLSHYPRIHHSDLSATSSPTTLTRFFIQTPRSGTANRSGGSLKRSTPSQSDTCLKRKRLPRQRKSVSPSIHPFALKSKRVFCLPAPEVRIAYITSFFCGGFRHKEL